jgi:hypothetical protein
MITHCASADDRIVELMIALARCSRLQPVLVVGAKSIELASELGRRGYVRVGSNANCGQAAGQYDVALVDWRGRTLRALQTTLDRLVGFLSRESLLVVWVDAQKAAVRQDLYAALERRGFVIEDKAVHEFGSAVSARRREVKPLPKAA